MPEPFVQSFYCIGTPLFLLIVFLTYVTVYFSNKHTKIGVEALAMITVSTLEDNNARILAKILDINIITYTK